MSRFSSTFGRLGACVALLSVALFAICVLNNGASIQADAPTFGETMTSDFLSVDNQSAETSDGNPSEVADPADEESVNLLNEWTYTGRPRPSRFF